MTVDIIAVEPRAGTESAASAVSWPAIFGGGVTAASTTVIMVLIGTGLGFAMVSPWPNAGASAVTFSIAAGIWLIVTQWLSAGLGGYVTGRLRTKWVRVHTHEVFFRDTAHGLLTWGLATVIGAMIALSAAGGVARTGATVAAQGAGAAAIAAARAYDADSLYRGEKPDLAASSADVRTQTTRILATGAANGDIPATDRDYLAGAIADRTGLSQDEARKRVDEVIAREKTAEVKAREAADAARKSAAAFSIFTAIAMLIGAFVACVAAAFGGSLRDEHP